MLGAGNFWPGIRHAWCRATSIGKVFSLKQIFSILAALMLIIITMTGCSTGKETDSPSGSESVSQIPQFAIATKIQADNPQSLIYTGNELRIPYMLRDQSEADAQWGLEIMLDGVLQDFTIDDGTDQFAKKKSYTSSLYGRERAKTSRLFLRQISAKRARN